MFKLKNKKEGIFDGILGSIIGGGLSFLGGESRNDAQIAQAQQANAFSGAQTQAQMDFQERMSNTAHQREAKDLKKAGLNRILTVTRGQGASSPAGASAIGQQADIKDTITPAVHSATQVGLAQAQIRDTNAAATLKENLATASKTVEKIAQEAERLVDGIKLGITPSMLKNVKENLPADAAKAVDNLLLNTKRAIQEAPKQAEKIITKAKIKIQEIIYHAKEFIEKGVDKAKINFTDKKGRKHIYNNELNEKPVKKPKKGNRLKFTTKGVPYQ